MAQGIAAVAAGLMGYLLTLWLDERQLQEWGWRIPFAAGLLVLPIGLYIRLNLAETLSLIHIFPTARAEHRSPERSQDFMTDGPLERLPGKTSDKNDT